jgi:hypothetical protein
MTGETDENSGAMGGGGNADGGGRGDRGRAALPPMWKRNADAWETIASEWPMGGGNSAETRRRALLGIFSFLGLPMDEGDMEKIRNAGGDEIDKTMSEIEKLLQ